MVEEGRRHHPPPIFFHSKASTVAGCERLSNLFGGAEFDYMRGCFPQQRVQQLFDELARCDKKTFVKWLVLLQPERKEWTKRQQTFWFEADGQPIRGILAQLLGAMVRRADDGRLTRTAAARRRAVCAHLGLDRILVAPELCAELDTCPRVASSVAQFFNKTVNTSQVPVFRKSGQWRLWMHKKAPWNVRAWYYGPKRTLPRNLTTYNASWFASQRSRAHRALQKYVRFRGDVVKRAAGVLDALASSKETDLLAVQPGASKCLVGVHARGTDADGRRSVQPVEAYVAVLAPVCSQLGSALAVYVATRAEIRRRGAFGRRL